MWKKAMPHVRWLLSETLALAALAAFLVTVIAYAWLLLGPY